MRVLLTLVCFFCIAGTASAQSMRVSNGNELYEGLRTCNLANGPSYQATAKEWDYCFLATGYVEGASAVIFDSFSKLFVVSGDVTQHQIIDVVHQYLEKNPAIRNKPSAVLISSALMEAWGTEDGKKAAKLVAQ
jgi:hypothetical protein